LAALAPAGFAMAQPLGSPVPPTIANPNRFAVTGVPAAARFFHLAATRRVDIAIIGDSNTRQLGSTGHEDGMGRAFAAKFGMYATRVDPFAGRGGWGAPALSVSSIQIPPFQLTGGPVQAEQYTFEIDGFPTSYGFLPAGTDAGWTYNIGLQLDPDNPVNISGNLRYHLSDYSMPGGTYAFSVRAPYPGDAFVDFHSAQIAPAPTPGIRDMSFAIPAGTRAPNGMIIVPADAQHVLASVGPLLPIYHRVENTDRTTGIGYSPMWFQGGQSARKVLETFYQYDRHITAMREWMRQAVREQGAEGILLVHIMHGGNDFIDSLPSLGPVGGIPSNLAAGQEDNTRGIINWLRARWIEAGRDPANLFFCLGPYHPQTTSLTSMQGYEQGWRNIVAGDPQAFTVAGSMLSTPDEFTALQWYRSPFESAHLAFAAYGAWGTTAVRALSRASCPGDFDENGTLSVNDIFAFLNAWLASDIGADVNYSGGLEVQDIFDFLNIWLSGC
jgi:hypothetical protein